ncbi:hypothetical protein [Pantanalinema sp. GBBB05]|uniref:hypothetical protein n=1 Tax=Pantanalinema sp. GBBB05 TaxID=2604139 RepID=UPI003D819767
MSIKSLVDEIADLPTKLPLWIVLIVPLMLLLTGRVVGYLFFRNGQKAISDVATQLRSEIARQIEEKLNTSTKAAHTVNRLNAIALARGDINIATARGEHKFWHLQASEAALRDRNDELRLREQELRLITDALPVCIFYTDVEQRYRFVNMPAKSGLTVVGMTFSASGIVRHWQDKLQPMRQTSPTLLAIGTLMRAISPILTAIPRSEDTVGWCWTLANSEALHYVNAYGLRQPQF